MRIAVIGGTAAGPAAAAEAKRAAPDAEVVLYEQDTRISVGACEIPYFVAGVVGEGTLETLTPEAFERTRGAKVRTRHRVTKLDLSKRTVTVEALDFGSVHVEPFDRCILATGARARRLGVEGEDLLGVFPIRTADDALAIRAWLDAGGVHHAVIIGGGFVGIEMADGLRHRGVRVTLLEPAGRVLKDTLSEAMAGPLMEAMRRSGVAVRRERVTAFVTDGAGRLHSIRTDQGERIGCQLALVAVGIVPNVELAQAAGLRLGATGALDVDDHMRTGHRAVWACGDAVEVRRVVDGKKVYWPLAPVGRQTARVAARNAARRGGPLEKFAGVTGAIGVRAFGIEAAQVGLSLPEAEAAGFDAVTAQVTHWSRVRALPEARPLHVRYVAERGSGRLLGGELVGEEGAALRADVLVPWIRAKTTVCEIAEEMDLLYHPPVAPAVDALRIAASAAWKAAAGRSRRRRT